MSCVVHIPEDITEDMMLRWRKSLLVLIGRDLSMPIVRGCHGHLGGCVGKHALLLQDVLGVVFLRKTDDPNLLVYNDIHPKDKHGFTKDIHAELLSTNGPLCSLDPLEGVKDDKNVIHVHKQNNVNTFHGMMHGVNDGVGCRSLEPKG
jgi:hypothetical protein